MHQHYLKAIVVCLLLALCHAYEPNPILDGASHTILMQSTKNGKLLITAANDVYLPILHVYGTPYEMGFAHGELMSKEIHGLLFNDLPRWYIEDKIIDDLVNEFLPEDIQERLRHATDADYVPAILDTLDWLWNYQLKYFKKSDIGFVEEINGIVDGYCSKTFECDYTHARRMIQLQSLFPELIRMACSILTTWGPANADGHRDTIQLRALDFGANPFANSNVVIVRHPSKGIPFASLAFPGFVGAVTSVSPFLAQAEKVYMYRKEKTAKAFPDHLSESLGALLPKQELSDLRPGTYDGLSDIFVIRRVMQEARTLGEAIDIMYDAKRTWPIFLGFTTSASRLAPGSKATSPRGRVFPNKPGLAFAYDVAEVTLIDDDNNDKFTGTPTFPGVIYLDKHVQPSTSDTRLMEQVAAQLGNITAEWVVSNVPAFTESGDVHIMLVDWNTNSTYISVGNAPKNNYGDNGQAYQRPFFRFNMNSWWNEQL